VVPLAFWGFLPGALLSDLDEQSRLLGGDGLVCRHALSDPRVADCRGGARDPGTGRPVELWLSAIDSVAGVLTISGVVTPEQLKGWRAALEGNYGLSGVSVQGAQRMLQWIRRGRMIRLTWRQQGNRIAASVSLIDGAVLDGWGRDRQHSRDSAASAP